MTTETLDLKIRNVRGIVAAEFDLAGRMTLLAGDNGSGKTTVLHCLRAILGSTSRPVLGGGKAGSEGPQLLRHGSTGGSIVLSVDSGSVIVGLPKWKREASGGVVLPFASRVALGLDYYPTMTAKERGALLASILETDPSRRDYELELEKEGIGDPKLSVEVWQTIQEFGWDAAFERAEEKGKKLVSEWRGVTGATWGKDVGATWEEKPIPAPAPIGQTDDTAELLRKKITDEINTEGWRKQEMEKAIAEREAAPLPEMAFGTFDCAHCGEKNTVMRDGDKDWRTVKGEIDPAELKRRREAREAFDKKVGEAQQAFDEARRHRQALEHRLEIARAGRQAAVQAVAEERQAAAERKTEQAHAIHERIMIAKKLAAILATTGLRQVGMKKAIEQLNEALAERCERMQTEPVRIDPDTLEPTAGGFAWPWLWSVRWRADVALVLELASRDGSQLVLIDDVDHIVDRRRGPVFAEIIRTGIRCVIAAASTRPDRVLDLKARGVGQTYWLDAGGSTPLSALQREAAE